MTSQQSAQPSLGFVTCMAADWNPSYGLQAFKAADVDLPKDSNIAPMHAITLPDNFNRLDFGLDGPDFTLE